MFEEVEGCACNVVVVQHLHFITKHTLHLLLAHAEWQYHGIPLAAAECAVIESHVILLVNLQTVYIIGVVGFSIKGYIFCRVYFSCLNLNPERASVVPDAKR